MLKQISILCVASAMLLLTGCSSKPSALMVNKQGEAPQALIKISNGSGAPSWAYNESKAFRNALETAATVTLKRDFKYFAIVKPAEISNINGSLKNTAKELIEVCNPSSAMVLNIPGNTNLHKCGVYNTQAQMQIAMYNEEQNNFTVINAQEVIDYLKTNDLYANDGVEIKNK